MIARAYRSASGTLGGTGKALAVKRDPRVSLCIQDEQWPLTYLQVYGDAAVEEDFAQAADVLRRVIDLMAGQDVSSAKLPEIERMAREEQRVVIRVRPYATFATPPLTVALHPQTARHVGTYQAGSPAVRMSCYTAEYNDLNAAGQLR